MVGYLIRNMCLLSRCYLEWLYKDGKITGKGTKAQISLRFLSNADLISDNPGALVPAVLGQVDTKLVLVSGMGRMCTSCLFFQFTVGSLCEYPCLTMLKCRKDVQKYNEY